MLGQLLDLLLSSNSRVITLALNMLPFSLSFSIATLLFINNVLGSYERYLADNYIGLQARLTVESRDILFLDEVMNSLKSKEIVSSKVIELRRVVNIETDGASLKKKITIISMDSDYMKKRFKVSKPYAINNVFEASLLPSSTYKIINSENEKMVLLKEPEVVNTGLLTEESILFISSELFRSFPDLVPKRGFTRLEFYAYDESSLSNIKKTIFNISKKMKVMNVSIKDRLLISEETKKIFLKIKRVEAAVAFIISFLSLTVLFLSLTIITTLKKRSLEKMRMLGADFFSITTAVMTISVALFLAASLGGVVLFKLMQKYFIFSVNLKSSFFIALTWKEHLFLVTGFFVTLLVSWLSTKVILKKF